MKTFVRSLLLAAAGCAVLALAACAGPVHNPDTAGSGSGVTVYGTADAGIGRTKR